VIASADIKTVRLTAGLDRPLPCPFCGSENVEVCDGSTFRWVYAGCGDCGAQAGEVRRQTLGEGTAEEWEAAAKLSAIVEWNRRSNVEVRGCGDE